jgi:hypothetical protein
MEICPKKKRDTAEHCLVSFWEQDIEIVNAIHLKVLEGTAVSADVGGDRHPFTESSCNRVATWCACINEKLTVLDPIQGQALVLLSG